MQIIKTKNIIFLFIVIISIGIISFFFKKYSLNQLMKGEKYILTKLIYQNRAIPNDYIDLGEIIILMNKKDFICGMSLMLEGLRREPKNFDFMIRIGEIYLLEGKKEDKEKGFDYLVMAEKQLDSDINKKSRPHYYARIGEIYYKFKRYEDAFRVVEKAIEIQKDDTYYLDEEHSINDPTFRKYLNNAKKELEAKIKKQKSR